MRESRVRLSDKLDALGVPRLDLIWQLAAGDLHSYRRFDELLFAALPQLGIQARRITHELDPGGWPVIMQIGKHHMGTTRMHRDARHGVVDENCRVHAAHNLFVAGSSVFPTSGMANPTLTILALALRLADYLKAELAA
jgi:choline dehydrogenase-like flavoprotein